MQVYIYQKCPYFVLLQKNMTNSIRELYTHERKSKIHTSHRVKFNLLRREYALDRRISMINGFIRLRSRDAVPSVTKKKSKRGKRANATAL